MPLIEKTRTTRETSVTVALDVDGPPETDVETGLPFFDHMLDLLAFHAGWRLRVRAEGDLAVDDHHTVEDVALVLGAALQEAWRARAGGFRRYGQRLLPMDEALVLAAVDLSGRPSAHVRLKLRRDAVGGLSAEMVEHFFASLAAAAQLTLHVRRVTGKNAHHVVEAAFKGAGRALAEALEPSDRPASTKGSL